MRVLFRTGIHLLVPILLAGYLISSSAADAEGRSATNAAVRIHLPAPVRSLAKREITTSDIVSLRVISEPRLSPDGTQVAFLLSQSFIDCNCTRTALFVAPVAGGSPRKLSERDSISSISWSVDGKWVAYLSSKGGRTHLWKTFVSTGASLDLTAQMFQVIQSWQAGGAKSSAANGGIESYAFSHSGECLAVVASRQDPFAARDPHGQSGVLYDDQNMRDGKLSPPRTAALFSSCGKELRRRWQTPSSIRSVIQRIIWSPDDSRIAYEWEGPKSKSQPSSHLGVFDVKRGTFTEGAWTNDGTDMVEGLVWDRSGKSVLFTRRSWMDKVEGMVLASWDLSNRRATKIRDGLIGYYFNPLIGVSSDNSEALMSIDGVGGHREMTSVSAIRLADGKIRKVSSPSLKLSDCDILRNHLLSCVAQSPSVPPRIVILNTENGETRALAVDANPEVTRLSLVKPELLRWSNKFGNESDGYLLVPTTKRPAQGYPLLVVGYTFDGDFVTEASSIINSYPAQIYAAKGIAVLLINRPRVDFDWSGPNFKLGSIAWGYAPLSTLDTIIAKLSTEGIVDKTLVGFGGHSWAGWWVQFALTQEPKLLKAAGLHNGGTLTLVGTYWDSGSAEVREIEEHFLGGPPYPPTLQNYVEFSPSLRGRVVEAPVLTETDAAESPWMQEMFTALQANDKPVEWYIYPDEGHVFSAPVAHLASLQRNLDWFRFWLQNYQDPDPMKKDQYERWITLRGQLH